jgi:pre-rRNA-processing protein TSR4
MSGTGGGGMEKLFESSMDKQFQKFADRMAQNPEQILRYELDGTPLLYSLTDSVGKLLSPPHNSGGKVSVAGGHAGSKIPRCANCGAERIFEVQLTPHAITVLEEEELSLEGMEWGTIIMGVCSKDCVPQGVEEGAVGYAEEWVGVQWEESLEKKR